MKLYAVFSSLDRSEWSGDTVLSSLRYSFELCLRAFVEDSSEDGTIVAHTSLYFEDVDDRSYKLVADLLPPSPVETRSFFVDILDNGQHRASTLDDPDGWYRKWKRIELELYPVSDARFDVHRVLERAAAFVRRNRRYDCFQNFNMVCPCWPVRCSPSLGLCCPCSDGTNCVDSVVVALAAGLGAEEWEAEEALGISKRVTRGARLPSRLRDELVSVGVVDTPPRVIRIASSSKGLPLLPLNP